MTAAAGEEVLDWPGRALRKRRRPRRLRLLAFPAVLAVGWGALFLYTSAYVLNEPPRAGTKVAEPIRVAEPAAAELPAEVPLVGMAAAEDALSPEVPPAAPPLRWANADPAPIRAALEAALAEPPKPTAAKAAAVPPHGPTPASVETRSAFVGTWGPVSAACSARGRRNGFIPATITQDGAKAGPTSCSFSEHRRIANGWTVSAVCSEGERQWSSQVRLTVDGDRLTWTSEKGASRYVRCGRRTS